MNNGELKMNTILSIYIFHICFGLIGAGLVFAFIVYSNKKEAERKKAIIEKGKRMGLL